MCAQPSLICDLAADERPRERLLAHGSRGLSDAELVAVLLRTGRRGTSALDLSRELLLEVGGLPGLMSLTGATSQQTGEARLAGLGEAKRASLLAAVEVGRRLARLDFPEREPMSRPREVARYLALRYCGGEQEVMGALFLDGRNRLVFEREIFRGTLSRAAVEPRAILKEALVRDASAVILFHTHPSGDPSPSAEDFSFTRRMVECLEVLGLRLIDHMVLAGPERWVSLRERRPW